jgi:hypothetical protein
MSHRFHIAPYRGLTFQVLDTEDYIDPETPATVFLGTKRQCELFLAKADWSPEAPPWLIAAHAASH